MRTTQGPARLTVLELDWGVDLTVYRIVRTGDLEDPVYLNCFRSHYELGEEPRKVERSSTVLHMGISTYLEHETAVKTAQRWSKLGDYVAELALKPGNGFNYAHSGHPMHLTIWGDPIKLMEATADIQAI